MSTTQNKKKQSKAAPSHPTYKVMVAAAIKATQERKGSSRQQIVKYIFANYKVSSETQGKLQVNRCLKKLTEKGEVIAPKGPSGRFKLAPAKKAEAAKKKPKPKKKVAPAKKPAVKRVAKTPVKKAKSKKAPVKKASDAKKKPAAKKAAKKPAAKKSPKKKVVKKPAKKSQSKKK